MSKMTVLIFDRNPHQKEYFIGSFQEEGISVLDAHDLKLFVELIDGTQEQLALLDYASLVSENRDEIVRLFRALKDHLTVVFNVPRDATKRIVFYELGALRVYDEGTSIEEVYRSIKWWMQVYKQDGSEAPADLQGELQTVDFLKLLWGISGSGKSGILKVMAPRNIGQLFFKDGQIIDARVLNHSGLDAFLHIVLWKEGRFVFKQTPTDTISPVLHLTLPGLMICAQNLKLEIEPILREFKSESSVLQAINLGDLPLYDISVDPEFLEYISIPRELAEILENPYYPNHETLRILGKLKHFGLLRINEPLETMIEQNEVFVDGVNIDQQTISEIAGDVEKIDTLSNILGLKEGQQAKLVVVAEDHEILKHYLNTLAGSPEKVFLENNMYFVRLRLAEKLEVILIGMRANHQLLRLLSGLSENIHGFIFLIDARSTEKTEYLSYLFNQVLAQYPVPSVAAVTYLNDDQSLDSLKKRYVLTAEFPWVSYSANSQSEMLETVLDMRPIELPKVKEPKAESEAEE